ncbi:MAG: threonylcarbamoyl-AMP synthase [Candidatus Aenigmarchaeota archaeon]|nr:threonylcarbamoyl-AMP synthase [Candidatus Aenigmarchaeota archaeon]
METLVLRADARGIKKAVEILKKGGLVIYPTETAYGIGCDATNRNAVKKVYKIKKRSSKKPLSVIFGSTAIAEKYVSLDEDGKRLVEEFMPGPLTLVARPKYRKLRFPIRENSRFSQKQLAGSPRNEIAFRIPANRFALSLAGKFKKPITATSANISGEKPVYSFPEAFALFAKKADAIINTGSLPKRKVSTIFNLITMKTVREGPISGAKIKKCLLSCRGE